MPLSAAALGGIPEAVDTAAYPVTRLAKTRNTLLDWLFYDVGNLTQAEYAMLLGETNLEGSILIVFPTGARGDIGVMKFAGHRELLAAPGDMLSRFAIAGVGSSDVGAASFARTVADRYDQPVGAIVAGYGMADLLVEAAGGWFVLGAANRLMKAYQDTMGGTDALSADLRGSYATLDAPKAHDVAERVTGLSDSATLFRLMLDEERTITSVAGHSKGSLSIAFALEALALTRNRQAVARAKAMRVTTAGAVVDLPTGFRNAGQYLGGIDWFGALNSEPDIPYRTVSGAWHHLNTTIPAHMDFADVLAGEPD